MTQIELTGLTKRYRNVTAVDGLTVTVAPGRVTGFVGANGAGKTTTMRMIVGLSRPTSGTATLDGRAYRDLADPLRTVGAMLDPNCFHPNRSGRDSLRVIARSVGIGDVRVDEVISQVDLTEHATRRTRGYSTGMRQRLALAAALLGDPDTLILDEPANGLDPQGIRWLRTLIRHLASQGRTVLVSSHQLAELSQTVDDVIIIDRGRLVTHQPMPQLLAQASTTSLEDVYLALVEQSDRNQPPSPTRSTR